MSADAGRFRHPISRRFESPPRFIETFPRGSVSRLWRALARRNFPTGAERSERASCSLPAVELGALSAPSGSVQPIVPDTNSSRPGGSEIRVPARVPRGGAARLVESLPRCITAAAPQITPPTLTRAPTSTPRFDREWGFDRRNRWRSACAAHRMSDSRLANLWPVPATWALWMNR